MTALRGRPGEIELHLGAGRTHMDGWVNCDLYPAPGVDVVFDLMQPWPFADNTVRTLYASHVLEHLPDPRAFFREAWRVCRPNAEVILRVPYGAHDSAMWDLTHLRPWFGESFCFLTPGYAEGTKNPQHGDWQWPFGIHVVRFRVHGRLAWHLRRRWLQWLWPYVRFIWNGIEELNVGLYPLKSPEAIAEYQSRHPAMTFAASYCAGEHHLQGKTDAPGPGGYNLVDIVTY